MSSNSFCAPCARLDNSSKSINFCMDCEETLCEDCVRAHKAIKVLMAHHLIDLEAVEVMPIKVMPSQKQCLSHSDFNLDYYCTYHDSLCCHNCIPVEHRGCDKVLTLKEASRDIKISALFCDITDGLNQMFLTTEEVIKDRENTIQKVEDEGCIISKSISNDKVSIMNKLEEMEKSALSKVSDLKGTLLLNLKSECSKAEQISKLVHEYRKQLEFLSMNGSNKQIFVLLQELKVILSDENRNIKAFIEKLEKPSLSYKKTLALASDQDFEHIEITYLPCSVMYRKTKYCEARLLFDIKKAPKSFILDHEMQIITDKELNLGGITGIVFIDHNKIAVSSYLSTQLYIYDIGGKRLKEIQLDAPCKPWGLAYNSTTQKLVVNLSNNKLQIVENFKAAPALKVAVGAKYDVSWPNDKMYVGGHGKIHILDSNLQEIQSHKVGKEDIFYLYYRDEKLYLSEFIKNNVYCIKEDGTVIFTFTSNSLKGPNGITSDGAGNIYVVGQYSNNIHRRSSDGKSSEIVLKEENGLNEPITICFSKNYRKLLISKHKGSSISVFDCVYK